VGPHVILSPLLFFLLPLLSLPLLTFSFLFLFLPFPLLAAVERAAATTAR
jgi:hypothetical protein